MTELGLNGTFSFLERGILKCEIGVVFHIVALS